MGVEPFPETTYLELSYLLKKAKEKKIAFLLRSSQSINRKDVVIARTHLKFKDKDKLVGFIDVTAT